MLNEDIKTNKDKIIWIDLDNSPHVPFFNPIIEELKKREYNMLITVRDCFQVCELADRFKINYIPIGSHHGKFKIIKLFGLIYRAMQLMPIGFKNKPKLALSHGSRAQMIVAKILNIPSVLIFDYEYTKSIPFADPTWAIAPEVIPNIVYRKKPYKVQILKYPGIKEDVYVPKFKPDSKIINELGLNRENIIITIRPPATEAHYHVPKTEELFEAVINYLGHLSNIQLILLPRNEKQKVFIKKKWPNYFSNGKIIIPKHAVDGLNLIWHSDLVISGGGTMNREAGALGVPVYTIFQSKIGAVDRYLLKTNRMTLIKNDEDIRKKIVLKHRNKLKLDKIKNDQHHTLQCIIEHLLKILNIKN